MAKLRDCLCQVCGIGYVIGFDGRMSIQFLEICPACIEWHKRCIIGRHYPLRSAFSPAKGKGDGLRTSCRPCVETERFRILSCEHCRYDFVAFGIRHSERNVTVCDDCYSIVKFCTRCMLFKAPEEFSVNKANSTGRHRWCVECTRAAWNENSEAEKFNKATGIRFGIDYSDYMAMLTAQGGNCAICNRPETDVDYRTGQLRRLSVDHHHATGQVRALLCGKCNKSIGLMDEDVDRLESAIEYLNKWSVLIIK